ncbi:hypothetical protein HZA40_03685 [Candidatus Peregrinibacteria bacterium]|nr:hypothetical protein [Candidatus Peregrinibacteria bacterium]
MGINIIQARELPDEQKTAQAVHLMQQEAAKEVSFMDVLTPEEIQELIRNGALYCICEDQSGIPMASLYVKNTGIENANGKQVYAPGGLNFFPGRRNIF